MVAYLIRLTTSIFGNSLFAVRLSAVILSTLILAVIFRWTDRHTTLGLVLVTPLFLFGGILITPDLPLAFFWVLYVSWFMSANRTLSEWHNDPITRVYRQMPVPLYRWIAAGIILGLGLLSKYTMVIAIPCGFLTLLKYRRKGWWMGYLTHLGVALLVSLPVLYFSWRHHFSPFQFQWDHSMRGAGFSLNHLANFLGSQVALLSALPFLFLPLALLKGPELYQEPRSHVALFFYVGPILFFLFKAFRGPLEANWALVAYLSFWPVAQRILDESSFRPVLNFFVAISFLPAMLISTALFVHLIHPIAWVKPEKDRVRKLTSQMDLAAKVNRDIPKGETLYTPTYQWTSYFRYLGRPAEQVYPFGRESHFTLVEPQTACDKTSVMAFVDETRYADLLHCFPQRTIVKSYPLIVRDQTFATFHLVRLSR